MVSSQTRPLELLPDDERISGLLLMAWTLTLDFCGSAQAHEAVWFSHPRRYGKGSREWWVAGPITL